MSVNEAGIHRHVEYAGGDLVRDGEIVVDTSVWVEPRWSINAPGIRGTHVLHHKSVQNVVELRGIEDATAEDVACLDVFRKAITVNRPEVIGTILGWVVACNLKHHLIGMGNEFPLLHLFGPSEVGKTKTAQILTALAGADYHVAPMVANSTTPFPLKEMASMTTTIPRIFDECTASTFGRTGHWLAVRDILKAAYQGSAVPYRYREGGGNRLDKTSAMSIQYRATAPIIFTATQATDDQELITRSICLQMDQKQKAEGTRQTDFEWLLMHGWRPLFRLTRPLIMDALQLSAEDVRLQLADSLQRTPLKMDGRLRKNLAVILLGLRNLRATLVTRGFAPDLIEVLDAIENKTVMWWEEQAVRAMRKVRRNEVDQTYQTLSDMAVATTDRVNNYLVSGTDYLLQNDVLYLSGRSWVPYKQFLRTIAERPLFSAFNKFRELVEREAYFLSYAPLPGIPNPEQWLAVNFVELQKRVDVSGFKPTRR